MAAVKAIRSEAGYEAALARIDQLMDAAPGTPEGEELDVLADLVEHYEERAVPMRFPSPVGAIAFRMEQAGLSQRDLVPYIGSRAKVSEVLAGKRPLTMPMARALHEHLGIPATVLLQDPGARLPAPLRDLDWSRFPIKAMARLGWIAAVQEGATSARSAMEDLIRRAGGAEFAEAALYRRNDHLRANAKTDQYALRAWCWKVLADASEVRVVPYVRGTVTPTFLRQLAQLSWSANGPLLAREYLAKHGVVLLAVPQLPRTYLDGAALRRKDGTPVVGLTLRYDRIDNFWFCLLHELAHVGRHMDPEGDAAFVDDLTLRDLETGHQDPREREADEWAEEALVPRAIWETSAVRQGPTPAAVAALADTLQVHPAVVAGKVRHEQRNYRLLARMLGAGEVRRQFGLSA
jgi:HTH-type transcriptional regulator/antitoxin HigA